MESLQKRLELYEQAKRLYKAERSHRKVAKKLKLSPSTVYNWVLGGSIPGRPPHSLTTKIQKRKSSDSELGWLAGIIDGEGSLMFHKVKEKRTKQGFSWTARLQVANTDMKIINKARELCGNSGHVKTNPVCDFRPTTVYAFSTSSNVMRYILPKIINMLVSKRRQAELLLEALKLLQEGPNVTLHNTRLEEIYQEMKKLNHRGV